MVEGAVVGGQGVIDEAVIEAVELFEGGTVADLGLEQQVSTQIELKGLMWHWVLSVGKGVRDSNIVIGDTEGFLDGSSAFLDGTEGGIAEGTHALFTG
jgi:hypothetical protein